MNQKTPVDTLFAWLRNIWPTIETVRIEDLSNIERAIESSIFAQWIQQVNERPSKFQLEAFRCEGLATNTLEIIAGHVEDFLVQAHYEVLPPPPVLATALSRLVPPSVSFTAFYEDNAFASTYFIAYYAKSGLVLVFSNIIPVEVMDKIRP